MSKFTLLVVCTLCIAVIGYMSWDLLAKKDSQPTDLSVANQGENMLPDKKDIATTSKTQKQDTSTVNEVSALKANVEENTKVKEASVVSQTNIDLTSQQREVDNSNTVSTTLPGLSPKEVYLKMAADYEKITTPEQYYEVQIKYNDKITKQKNEKILADIQQGSFTEAEKNSYDSFLSKIVVPISQKINSNIKDINENISASKATLTISLVDGNSMKVDLVLEDNMWRVVKDYIVVQ